MCALFIVKMNLSKCYNYLFEKIIKERVKKENQENINEFVLAHCQIM